METAAAKMAFGAYEPKDRYSRYRSSSFKIMLVSGDCLLLGLQPVLVSPGTQVGARPAPGRASAAAPPAATAGCPGGTWTISTGCTGASQHEACCTRP